MLNTGDKAPYFELPNQDGETVKLTDLKGKNVVLYFYPKDDTSGCTKEACSFRDELSIFEGVNATIIGVSGDSVKSHRKFADKYSLNFTLLSDESKQMLEAYGVWKEKSMYGKKYMGIERTTFVIDPEGTIKKVFNKVKVDGHTEEVKKALSE
ncbi:MAG: thioredoxin-dependent thiol peroxidase [Ignavibacteria bacterium]|nr:thioredoxin-dependent thiol peroxidase [Ignavibacteria bacterium]